MSSMKKSSYLKEGISIFICLIVAYISYGILVYRNRIFEVIALWEYTFVDYATVLILTTLFYCMYAYKRNNWFAKVLKDIYFKIKTIISDCFAQFNGTPFFLLGVIILFVMIYGYQICNFTLSLDEEYQMTEAKNIIPWCYEGRFTIAILKNIFMYLGMYQPFLSSFIASVIMIFNGILVCDLLDRNKSKRASIFSKLAFICFFASFPSVIVEYMSFSTYCIEVSLGSTFLIFAVYFLDFYFTDRKKRYLLLNIFLIFIALGVYQAMATVYITLVSMYFFMEIYTRPLTRKTVLSTLKKILVSVFTLGVGCLIFLGAYKIATTMHFVQGSIDYINGFSGWDLDNGIWFSLKRSICRLYEILFQMDILGLGYFRWYILFTCSNILILFLFEKKLNRLILPVLAAEVMCSGFYMWIVLASVTLPFRAWLSVPFISGFTFYLFVSLIEKHMKHTTLCLSCFLVLVLGFRQVQTINELFINDHKRMEKDLNFAESIYHDIVSKDISLNDKTIVFIGVRDLADNPSIIKNPSSDLYWGGDALGYSLWRRAQEPMRMHGLYNYLGYDLYFEPCTVEDVKMAQKEMDVYPLEGSIKIEEDKVYVRLE